MDKKTLNEITHALTSREKAVITSMEWIDGPENPLERFGIGRIVSADSPKPIYAPDTYDEEGNLVNDYCVSYPTAAAVAASFNKEASYQIGRNMGRDCKARGIHVLYRPAVNIKRSPLGGRNFEYYSEDPVLSGDLAAAFIRGVQEEGTAACIKHYAVYNQEFERTTTNAVVSERALREIYLRAFQIAIEDSDPWSLMTSYNKINGEYVNASAHVMGILRDEMKYDGYVVSDARAVQDGIEARSHENGLDFELGGTHHKEVQDALDRGILPESAIDENIRRTIEVYEKCEAVKGNGPTDRDEEHELSGIMAADSEVLLVNSGILPLDPKEENIAVIGAMAKECHYSGGGSVLTKPYKTENPYEEMCRISGRELAYAPAYHLIDEPGEEVIDAEMIAEAKALAGSKKIVVFFAALPFHYEGERGDRTSLSLPKDQIAALNEVLSINSNVVLVVIAGSPVDLSSCTDLPALLFSYLAGEAMGCAVARVLYGLSEPGGRLPETFPTRIEDTPSFLTNTVYPIMNPNVLYGEDLFVGYRWYEKRKIRPLFPFGHGLSYSTFSYRNLELDRKSFTEDETLSVKLSVRNTGKRKASQVIQLYISKDKTYVIRPVKELKAFEKVYLDPGEEKTIEFKLNRRAFEYYSEEQHRWIAERGVYHIAAGVSSENMIARADVFLDSSERSVRFNSWLSTEWISRDAHVKDALSDLTIDQQKNFIKIGDRRPMGGDPLYTLEKPNMFRRPENTLSADEVSRLVSKLNSYPEEMPE